MRLGAVGGICLLFVPLSAALPNNLNEVPRGALDRKWDEDLLRMRGIFDPIDETTSKSSPAATTSTPAPTSTSDPTTTTPTTSSTPTSTSTPTSAAPTSATPPPTSHTSATRLVVTNDDGDVTTVIVTPTVSATTSSASAAPSDDNSSSSPGKGTYIGLGVAGGVALLGLAGFIVWKFTQKRFSNFDDDDAEDIKWPAPKEQLQPPAAPAMSVSNATTSSVDLTHDPYAVPPLPVRSGPYYDDPSGTAGAAYYDPYRGPVPHSFNSPPQSTEGHSQAYTGEAIPMSTYSSNSGRQSPGPNAAYGDPYARAQSPGPNMGYEDPYAGRRSPGPGLAYGMDPARTGTPVSMAPPRMGTPLGGGYGGPQIPGLDVPRTGTPQGYGRASPAIPPGYAQQQPLVNPYGRSTPNPYGP